MHNTHQPQTHTRERQLDRERAASMADEGGVSGAIVDAREQTEATLALHTRWGAKRIWAFTALGAGVWLMSVALRRLLSRTG